MKTAPTPRSAFDLDQANLRQDNWEMRAQKVPANLPVIFWPTIEEIELTPKGQGVK